MPSCCGGSSSNRPVISDPKDFQHRVHTEYNAESRQYQGLPPQWQSLVNQPGPRPKPIVEGLALTDEETRRILAALPPIHPEHDPDLDLPASSNSLASPSSTVTTTAATTVTTTTTTSMESGVSNGLPARQYPASTHAEDSATTPTSASGGSLAAPGQVVVMDLASSSQAGVQSNSAAFGKLSKSGSKSPTGLSAAGSDLNKKPAAQPHHRHLNVNGNLTHEEFRAQLEKHVSSETHRQSYDNFVRVGEGSTGVVVTAKDLAQKRVVAIKKMDLRKQQRRELLFNEVGCL